MTKSATLSFAQFQTREGIEWEIRRTDTNLPATLVGATTTLRIYNDDRIIVNDRDISADIPSPKTAGLVHYYPNAGDMDIAGDYDTELQILFGDGSTGYILDVDIIIRTVKVGT
jgi:hypothetical protein